MIFRRLDPGTVNNDYEVNGENETIISVGGTFQLGRNGGAYATITLTSLNLPYPLNSGDLIRIRPTGDSFVGLNTKSSNYKAI